MRLLDEIDFHEQRAATARATILHRLHARGADVRPLLASPA